MAGASSQQRNAFCKTRRPGECTSLATGADVAVVAYPLATQGAEPRRPGEGTSLATGAVVAVVADPLAPLAAPRKTPVFGLLRSMASLMAAFCDARVLGFSDGPGHSAFRPTTLPPLTQNLAHFLHIVIGPNKTGAWPMSRKCLMAPGAGGLGASAAKRCGPLTGTNSGWSRKKLSADQLATGVGSHFLNFAFVRRLRSA